MGKKILILSVDRDNDIGRKTKFNGPIIGKEDILKLAQALGLSDPEEADMNALYEAVKMADMLKNQGDVEVATLTGDKKEGLVSDQKIAKQLDEVLKKFPADGAVLVTDGLSDEFIVPVIQSKIPIISVKRVIVRQSEKLEGMYYLIETFFKESVEDPRLARIVFGVPALILLIFAFLGTAGWQIVLGAVGAYLLVKGFQLENFVNFLVNEIKVSLTKRKTAFFMYIAAFALFAVGVSRGLDAVSLFNSVTIYGIIAAFISGSVYIFFLSEIVAWVGWLIVHPEKYARSIPFPILGFSITFLLYSASEVILRPETGFLTLIISILLGFLLVITTLTLEYKK